MSINVLIPMAGLGSRFIDEGYKDPKPMIDVNGKPMIAAVVESLNIKDATYIFIVQWEHLIKYSLDAFLEKIAPGCRVIAINGITDGAAVTTLMAQHFIDNDTPLIIANSDQIVEWDSSTFCYLLNFGNAIALFNADDAKWSYAEIVDNFVTRVAEKEVISNNASVGIYGWTRGSDYVKYAKQMIQNNIKTNDEFYVCPVYNEAIQDGKIVIPYFVDKMYGIGTPEDLKKYLLENE